MRTLPREAIEELIAYLSETYPKAIFLQAHLKRPLKKNIVADLERDRVLDPEKREAAIGFYTKDWAYERTLQAGAKRIDLQGREVGVVTELEEREAKARVAAKKREIKEREAINNAPAIVTARRLHANGEIPTDSLSKITAPPITKETIMVKAKQPEDPFTCIVNLIDKTRKSLQGLPEDPDLYRAFTVAGLRVIVSKCETTIANLEDRHGEFHFSAESDQPY